MAATTVWQNLGITFIILIAGLQGIPDDLYESARVDGASSWLQFREITIPMLSPTLLFASVILTINAFKSFGQIDLLTEGGPGRRDQRVVYSIYQQALKNHNAGVASAQAVILFLIMLVLSLIQFTFFERRVHYAGGGRHERGPGRRPGRAADPAVGQGGRLAHGAGRYAGAGLRRR